MPMPLKMIAFSALFFFAMHADAFAAGKGQSTVHELVVDGVVRTYLVYKPMKSYPKKVKQLPLMIVLHGGLGNAKHMEEMTGMSDIADSGSFIVAYPDGTGGRFPAVKNRRTWNAGLCCGWAVKQNVDDVLFIKKMIEDIHARYSIDSNRVYVTGMSNGAMMAYRLACEIPDRIAAIIPVAGTLAVDNCDAAKDIPVLHIHGDQDENVPFAGGMGKESVTKVVHRSVQDTMNLLTRPRQCSDPEQKTLDGGVKVFSYRCSKGAPVELYVIKGGEHVWPGGHRNTNRDSDNKSISASKTAWEFAKQFSKHSK